MADAKVSALTELSVPDLADLLYAVDDPAGTPASVKVPGNRFLGLLRGLSGFRLTTESGTPVSTADRTAQSTLYLTPDPAGPIPGMVSLYDGTRWKLYSNAEVSLALSGLTSGKNYDVFLYDNAGTPTLELSAAWTTDTTRADALTTQNNVHVKSGATTRRYLGTIRTTGTTTTEDSGGGGTTQVGGRRFVWNLHNRVPRHLAVIDTTDSWSNAAAPIRQANGAAGNKVEYVCGLGLDAVEAVVNCSVSLVSNSARAAIVGVGVDSVTAFAGQRQGAYNASGSNVAGTATGLYRGHPGAGYHYLSWLESGADGTCVFVGDNGGDGRQAGLYATVWG